MPMFPLGTVLFPHALLPLHVFEPRYRADDRSACCATTASSASCSSSAAARWAAATRASTSARSRASCAPQELPDGGYALATVGIRRIRVTRWLPDDPYPLAEVADVLEPVHARRGRGRHRLPARARSRSTTSSRSTGGSTRACPTCPRCPTSPSRRRTSWPRSRRSGRSTRSACSRPCASRDRLALLAELLDDHARVRPRRQPARLRLAAGEVRYARRMTQHFDEDAARSRLVAEQERVHGLIASLHDRRVSIRKRPTRSATSRTSRIRPTRRRRRSSARRTSRSSNSSSTTSPRSKPRCSGSTTAATASTRSPASRSRRSASRRIRSRAPTSTRPDRDRHAAALRRGA